MVHLNDSSRLRMGKAVLTFFKVLYGIVESENIPKVLALEIEKKERESRKRTDRIKISKSKITDLQNENVILMNYPFLFLNWILSLSEFIRIFPSFNLPYLQFFFN